RERGLRRFSGDLGELLDLAIDVAENGLRADADFFEYRRDDALFVFEQGGQQVYGQKLGVAVLGGKIVGALDCFLSFYGEFVPTDGHGDSYFPLDATRLSPAAAIAFSRSRSFSRILIFLVKLRDASSLRIFALVSKIRQSIHKL